MMKNIGLVLRLLIVDIKLSLCFKAYDSDTSKYIYILFYLILSIITVYVMNLRIISRRPQNDQKVNFPRLMSRRYVTRCHKNVSYYWIIVTLTLHVYPPFLQLMVTWFHNVFHREMKRNKNDSSSKASSINVLIF